MMSPAVRAFLARSTISTRVSSLVKARLSAPSGLHNTVVAFARPVRAFSVSAHVAYPAATTKKTGTTGRKKAVSTTKKTTTKKKTTARAGAAKKTTKKKAAPKKRKVAATKKKVTVKKTAKGKKVVPKKETPRNNPALRPPPRALSAFAFYAKKMWPTITPKPKDAVEGLGHVRIMWNALNAQERKPFEDEAAVISAERKAVYEKWRNSLSASDVRRINEYRGNTKHNKLGPKTGPKKAPSGYLKFYTEKLKDGTIDPTKKPADVQFISYASKEASKLWKGLSDTQKAAYKS